MCSTKATRSWSSRRYPECRRRTSTSSLTGDVLALSAVGPKRKYEKEVLLPAAVDPAAQRQSYQNGYLELRFNKTNAEG